MKDAAFLLVGLGLGLASCEPPPREVRRELLTRSSCGWSTQEYDTSCVAALDVRLVDSEGTLLRSHCTAVGGQYASLASLVGTRELVRVLEDVTPRGDVAVELRAYHSRDKTPCVSHTDDELMLWGRSELFDLNDAKTTVVNVILECRPECDCAALDADATRCPAALVRGACAPPLEVPCGKSCRNDDECYAGRLPCLDGRCAPQPGDLCASCEGATACQSGLCVENTARGERFCADVCPEPEQARACSETMSCKRLGDALVLVP